MTLDLGFEATWGGTARRFRLDLYRLNAIEGDRGCAISEVYRRTASGQHFAQDLFQVLRHGLAGSGEFTLEEASRVTRERLDLGRLGEAWAIAASLLLARMTGGAADLRRPTPDAPMRLDLGRIMDAEEACGRVGIGELFLRLGQHRWFVRDVRHLLRQGLLGAGMTGEEAENHVRERLEREPLLWAVDSAQSLVLGAMSGIPEDTGAPEGDPREPLNAGAILASFAKVGIAAGPVRATSWRDFVLTMRAAGKDRTAAPSEEEYRQMIARANPSIWTREVGDDGEERGDGTPPQDGGDPSDIRAPDGSGGGESEGVGDRD